MLWGDPLVTYWGVRHDEEESRAQLQRVLERCARKPWPVAWFRVGRREDEALVGNVCLQPAPWDTNELEVGWHLLPAHRGRGYATEAASALVDEAFARLTPARLVCSILPDNLPSQRVAKRLGFVRYAENFLRAGLPHDLLELT